jgi:hypothetical protein
VRGPSSLLRAALMSIPAFAQSKGIYCPSLCSIPAVHRICPSAISFKDAPCPVLTDVPLVTRPRPMTRDGPYHCSRCSSASSTRWSLIELQ